MNKLGLTQNTGVADKKLLLGALHLMDSTVATEWKFCMAEVGSDRIKADTDSGFVKDAHRCAWTKCKPFEDKYLAVAVPVFLMA